MQNLKFFSNNLFFKIEASITPSFYIQKRIIGTTKDENYLLSIIFLKQLFYSYFTKVTYLILAKQRTLVNKLLEQ